jgi:small subunit ribosomal protein S6
VGVGPSVRRSRIGVRVPGQGGYDDASPPATETPWPPSPKEVETALRAYEVMVILDPDLEERTVAPSLEQYLNNVVVKDGGTVEKVDVWGRRRLAYEVDKNAEGIYAVIDLQAEPATVKELDRQLSLNESVLRTKVIRPDVR